jgi:putative addiction module component (TIGR02574 family)
VSKAEILEELPKLRPDELREIRAKLNALTTGADDAWIDDGELTEEEKARLDARLAEYEKNPNEGSSWEEVEARLRTQIRE